jgi:hypothetical protein
MSVWLEIPELNRVRTVLPCHPDSLTLVAYNFHIKASRVWTIGSVVRMVDLMYTIFIYEARGGNYLFPPSTTSHCQHAPMN